MHPVPPASAQPRRTGLVLALLVLPALLPLLAASGAALGGVYSTCPAVTLVPRDVVIVFDRSASMLDPATPGSTQTKLAAAKQAADLFLGQLSPTRDQSALVSFSSSWTLDKGLSFVHTGTGSTQAAVDALVADGATALGAGVRLGRYELDNGQPAGAPDAPYSLRARSGATHIMIVVSDGDQTVFDADPLTEAAYAKTHSNIVLYTVAVGTAISQQGLQVMQSMATDTDHAYWVPNALQLPLIMQDIFSKMNDQYPPWAGPVYPLAQQELWAGNLPHGPSPVPGMASVVGAQDLFVVARDDCLLRSVTFTARVTQADGSIASLALPDLGSASLGANFTQWFSRLDCDQLPGGLHALDVVATDFLGKTASESVPFACIRAAVDASARAVSLRTVNPVVADVASHGAALPGPVGGSDARTFLDGTLSAAGISLRAQLLQEEAHGAAGDTALHPEHIASGARSIVGELTLAGLTPLDARAFDGQASAGVDADPAAAFALRTDAASDVETGPAQLDALQAQVWDEACTSGALPASVGGATVSQCAQVADLGPGITAYRDERITVRGLGFEERTVHALRVEVHRPDVRAELILGEAYAGASWLGETRLRGAWHALDAQDDAGLGADAPDDAAQAAPLVPGTYGGMLVGQDVDAYVVDAHPGQKVHAVVVPSSGAVATLQQAPPLPAAPGDAVPFAMGLAASAQTGTVLRPLEVQLLDREGDVRDDKVSLVAGAAVPVELNVDEPGGWVVRISGQDVNYTLQLTVADAPMTHADDALEGSDAGPDCGSAMLVGPGAHLGTLEDQDEADWYRFSLQEGQLLTLTLRPGDTPDSAAMSLALYGPDCQLLVQGTPVLTGLVKGMPTVIVSTVPPGLSGLYRAEVHHVNGLGTYELVVAPSVLAV